MLTESSRRETKGERETKAERRKGSQVRSGSYSADGRIALHRAPSHHSALTFNIQN